MGLYRKLLVAYGPQHWWPASWSSRELEVIAGAVLTQNTTWANVEKALGSMEKEGLTTVEKILSAPKERLEWIIRPSGFFRQKAERLRGLLEVVRTKGGVKVFLETVTRDELLELKGIGPETADSILLYAAGRPEFVVDAYTRRVCSRLGMAEETWKADKLKQFFEQRLRPESQLFNEFHALIVRHAKERCRKEPACGGCPLEGECAYVAGKRWFRPKVSDLRSKTGHMERL